MLGAGTTSLMVWFQPVITGCWATCAKRRRAKSAEKQKMRLWSRSLRMQLQRTGLGNASMTRASLCWTSFTVVVVVICLTFLVYIKHVFVFTEHNVNTAELYKGTQPINVPGIRFFATDSNRVMEKRCQLFSNVSVVILCWIPPTWTLKDKVMHFSWAGEPYCYQQSYCKSGCQNKHFSPCIFISFSLFY